MRWLSWWFIFQSKSLFFVIIKLFLFILEQKLRFKIFSLIKWLESILHRYSDVTLTIVSFRRIPVWAQISIHTLHSILNWLVFSLINILQLGLLIALLRWLFLLQHRASWLSQKSKSIYIKWVRVFERKQRYRESFLF